MAGVLARALSCGSEGDRRSRTGSSRRLARPASTRGFFVERYCFSPADEDITASACAQPLRWAHAPSR